MMRPYGPTPRRRSPIGASSWFRPLAAIVALAMVAVACGSDGAQANATAEVASDADVGAAPDDDAVAVPTESAETEPEVVAVDDTDTSDEPVAATVVELGEPDWDGLDEWVLPAFGGVRFGVPTDLVVHHDADMVIVRTPFDPDSGRYDPSMVVALVAKDGSRRPVTSIEEMTGRLIDGIATAEATGTTFELFGETLEGWRFQLNPGLSDGPHYLYGAYPHGIDGLSSWQPLPHAELFFAEVPDGVLAAGWTARTDAELDQARAIFERVAPTFELTGTLGGDRPIEALPAIGGEPIAPVALPDGVEPFERVGLPVKAGTHNSPHLGTPLSFTVGEGWSVQPNFPGWVILTGAESFGPGDRGLSMRVGLEQLVPTHRSGAAGSPIPFDLAAVISDPPAGIDVSGHGEFEVGGARGTVTDIAISASASCSPEEPCEYALLYSGPFPPERLRKGYSYRLWHLTEGVELPITIIAEAPHPEWLAIAEDVVESIELLTAT